jgi:1-acyl-sn-glycerol-3-phosphate acyltransferase
MRFLLRHTLLRRACSFGALALLGVAALVLLPLALLTRPFGGRRRPARFAAFTVTYLGAEISGLCAAARLDPRDEDAHQAVLHRLLGRLFRRARREFALEVAPLEPGFELPDGPLLVFSRHAGPGDSFLLVYALLAAGRRPRVVLTERLELDPLIDIVLHRTPNCFVGRGPERRAAAVERIGTLAGQLGEHDALLLFPEGGNFTTARRSRLIARLRSLRDWRRLPVARSLEHVLPARPTGVFAAVDAAPPGTRIVFVAHTGLDRLESVADVWHAVPLDFPVRAAWWAVPVERVPGGEQERIAWLEREWARVDAWIERRAEPAVEDLVAPAQSPQPTQPAQSRPDASSAPSP